MYHLMDLGIELYLGAMLGVSGMAKAERPDSFEATLRRHRILPQSALFGVSRTVPYLEILAAFLLVVGLARLVTALVVVGLFASFLATEAILVVTKRASECGCFGLAYPQKVDGGSVVVTMLLLLLAVFHLWAVLSLAPTQPLWRAPGMLLFAVAMGLVIRGMVRRAGGSRAGRPLRQDASAGSTRG